jgi:hypothetical protein
MSDIEKDLKELGASIWPDPTAARQQVLGGRGRVRPRLQDQVTKRAGAALGSALAVAVIGAVSVGAFLVGHGHIDTRSRSSAVNGAASANVGVAGGQPDGHHSVAIGATPAAVLAPAATAGTHAQSSWPPTSAPSPRTQVAPGTTLTLNQNSRGTFIVRPGTTILVQLSGGGASTWTMPATGNGAVVRFESGSSSNGSATATFVAGSPGQATIQAGEAPRCPPICGPPSRLWQVEITVASS